MPPNENKLNAPERTLELDNYIDKLCDVFEQQWRSGIQPDLLTYLERVTLEQRPLLFSELLPLDWEFRMRGGNYFFLDTYLPLFPEFAAEIEQLDLQRRLLETVGITGASTLGDSAFQGARIGHFQLEERLGAGAVGEVWKAKDLLLERSVTIKFPRKARLSESEAKRFQKEGQAAAQLQHVGIVAVHEVGRQDALSYIVSDYIEGQDLRHWLMKQRPTTRQAAEICAELAEALHHAHQRSVIHRDLKPANVIVDKQGLPHITDFGLAKWDAEDSELTLEGDLLGTPAYMSPEQARGEAATSDHRSDIYSLGVLLYELLTGRCPFVGDHASVLNRVIYEQPQQPRAIVPSVPRDIETICLKALEKNPSRRYPSSQEMAVDLRRFLRGEAIIARRVGLLERTVRWMRKRPAVVVAGTMGIIAIAAVVGMLIVVQQEYEVQGYRTVLLRSEPPGTKVTFVPLSDQNGKPLLDKIVRAAGRTPLNTELEPGTYLTVVVLDDERFHEVLRRVPAMGQSLAGAFDHSRWTIDERGTAILPMVTIPAANVPHGMALIDAMTIDSKNNNAESEIAGSTPSFYLDPAEVPLREFRRVSRGMVPTDSRSPQPMSDEWPVSVNYDEVLRIAEKIGKSLPWGQLTRL